MILGLPPAMLNHTEVRKQLIFSLDSEDVDLLIYLISIFYGDLFIVLVF